VGGLLLGSPALPSPLRKLCGLKRLRLVTPCGLPRPLARLRRPEDREV